MNAAATQCRNCEAPLSGARRFCAACGQRVIEGRLTMRHIGHDIVYVLTHADNSVFALMRSLATRPGYVARDYIEGKRKSYVGPVAALVITVGLAGLVTLIFGMQWFAQVDEVPARYVLQEHMNVVIMFQVPLLALLCWMFFWKAGLHYAEHLVFAAYTAAFRVLFLACIEIPLLWLLGLTTATLILYIVYVSFWLAYFSFAASQFYRGNRAWSAVKAVCVAVVSQGLTILAVFAFSYVLSRLDS